MRRHVAAYTELESWSVTAGGSLLAALRHTFQNLILWGDGMSPPNYTHGQLVLTLQIQGAKKVLNTLLDEVMAHTEGPYLETALDVLVVMITAPQAQYPEPNPHYSSPSRRQINLQEALTAQLEDVHELAKKEVNRATMIVRIHRRVGALSANQQGQQGDVNLPDATGQNMTLDMGGEQNMPAVDIDDVLDQANEKTMGNMDLEASDDPMGTIDFLGGSDDFMNLG